MKHFPPPLGLIAELTHRCPLSCPYCSNPLQLERIADELDTASWLRVLDQAAVIGVLQVHFPGGAPLVRRDLTALVTHATSRGLYTNIITSGVTLDDRAMASLMQAGVDRTGISVMSGKGSRYASSSASSYDYARDEGGFWSSLKGLFVPD